MSRSPYHLHGLSSPAPIRRGRVMLTLPWKSLTIVVLLALTLAVLAGCGTCQLNRQTLDQVDAAIKSAEGFKARAAKGEAVPAALVDIHLDNLKVIRGNVERAVSDE